MLKDFLFTNLINLHSGSVGTKLLSSFKLTIVPAVGISLTERLMGWYLDSQLFILLLMLSLFADLILGIWKHLKLSSFSFKKMLLGFIQKLGVVILGYFLTEAFIQILADADLDSVYFKVATKLMLFVYPTGNAFVNMGIITNGKFPPLGLLKRFEKFNKTLDINTFTKNKIDETENDNPDSSE